MKNEHRSKTGKKGGKNSAQKKKYPLRGKPVRIPGNDKGKVIIMPDFDKPLTELDL